MTATWVLNWFNLIFVVPFALALAYLGLYTLSGWTFGEADVDADADADVDADAEVEVDADADADAAADHDPDHDHDHDAAHGGGGNGSGWFVVLSWLGVGRVPLSILLMILLMCWGAIGFAVNSYTRAEHPQVARPWVLSIPIALLGSVLVTKLLAGAVGRYVPLNETYARRRHELLGSRGEVVLPVDRNFGMVAVRDARGERFQLSCRLESGDRTIAKGTPVTLVAYNADERLFYVIESEFDGARDATESSTRSAV